MLRARDDEGEHVWFRSRVPPGVLVGEQLCVVARAGTQPYLGPRATSPVT